jgi:hypothetical protein
VAVGMRWRTQSQSNLSLANSLLTGKFTGNLNVLAPCPALAAAITRDSNGLQQNSLRSGTGNFSEQNKETGIAEQGTVAADWPDWGGV